MKIKENEKLIKSQSFLNLFNKNPINLKKDKDIIKAAKYLSRSCSKGKNKSKNISNKNSKESSKIIKTKKKEISASCAI